MVGGGINGFTNPNLIEIEMMNNNYKNSGLRINNNVVEVSYRYPEVLKNRN